MSMSFKASPDGTYGEILVNGQVVAKLPVTGNAVIPGLVGTVSQSGGVPTGAVVERGSNANGKYVRFADGTQICWYFWCPSTTIYSNRVAFNWAYPAIFTGYPCLSGNLDLSVVYHSGWDVSAIYATTSETTPNSGTLHVTTTYPNAATGWGDQRVVVIAIGRWF